MELPIFKLIVTDDDEIGVTMVSIVDDPATQSYAAYFKSNEPKEHKFQIFDEEKRLAMGALMVADKPIYRIDDKGREYYVILDGENIDKAMQKFFAKGYQNNVNMMHDPTQIAEGVTMYQHFIINREMGIKTPKGFDPLPYGSSFGIYKVNNDEVWTKIKAGQFGFSIEGMFKEQPIIMITPEEVEAVLGALKKAQDKIV